MKQIFPFIMLLAIFFANAQEVKFGKISEEELTKKTSLIDREAAAEILQETVDYEIYYVNSTDLFNTRINISKRIKIYNKSNTPEHLLNLEIPLYKNGGIRDVLTNFKAFTYNWNNGELEEIKMNKKDLIKEEVHEYQDIEKLAFQGVKDGSVLEYTYTIEDPGFRTVGRWFFQDEVPKVYSRMYVSYPEFFIFSKDIRGSIQGQYKFDRKTNARFDFMDETETYTYRNVPALKGESFVINPDNLRASVLLELKEYNNPGVGYQNFSATWEKIAKTLSEDNNVWGQIKGNNFLDETVNTIISEAKSDEQKMALIFNWVKKNTRHNSFISIFKDYGVRKTFKEGKGNSADINLLLISMIRKAGIEANPVVLSPVNYGIINYSFPSFNSLRHLIAAARIGEGIYLMDATDDFSGINMLPLQDLNDRGFEIKEDGSYSELNLVNTVLSEESKRLNIELQDNLSVKGHLNIFHKNYFAMQTHREHINNPQKLEKKIRNQYDYQIDDFKIQINESGDASKTSVSVAEDDAYLKLEGKIFLNPLMFLKKTTNPFKAETRNYQIEFSTPFVEQRIVRIAIPKGYKVSSLPVESKFEISNGIGGYIYQVEEKNGYILTTATLLIKYPALPPSYHDELKKLYQNILAAENNQVVLVENKKHR